MNDIQQMVDALRLFCMGDRFEIRSFDPKPVKSMHFQDPLTAAKWAVSLGEREGIYFTLNPVREGQLAGGTQDVDVTERRWIMIDIDPTDKPNDPEGMATNADHAYALEYGQKIIQDMKNIHHWPEPVVCDSGNGCHLMYRVSRPDEAVVKRVVNWFKSHYSNKRVKIDPKVSNLSRVTRLYGTENRRGEVADERPYRMSKVISVTHETVSNELLEALAPESELEKVPRITPGAWNIGKIEKLLSKYYTSRYLAAEETHWGIKWMLEDCPFNSDHQRAAVFLSRTGVPWFHCFHNSCKSRWAAFYRKLTGESPPTFDPLDMARKFITEELGDSAIYCYKQWYEWQDVYQEMQDDLVKIKLAHFVAEELKNSDTAVTIGRVETVLTIVKNICYRVVEPNTWINDCGPHGDFLAVQNGLLNVRTGVLEPHTPDWFSTNITSYPYDPKAGFGEVDDILTTNLAGNKEMVRLIYQWFGYIITRATGKHKALFLTGPGGSGKSTCLAMMQALVGHTNCSTISISSLSSNFEAYNTLGKMLNVSGESGEFQKPDDVEKWKQLTGGDLFNFAVKYNKKGISAKPTARWAISCNKLPKFPEGYGSLERRLIIVPFDHPVPAQNRRENLDDYKWWEQYGAQLLNTAMAGYADLAVNGFVQPVECVAARTEHLEDCNPVIEYARQFITKADGERLSTIRVYQHYKEWGATHGYKCKNANNFWQEVKRCVWPLPTVTRSRQGNYYEGFRFEPDVQAQVEWGGM